MPKLLMLLAWIGVSAAAQTFDFDITVSDDLANSQLLVLGMHPDATDDFDSGIDTGAPPLPPVGGFDARLRIASPSNDFIRDIRGSSSEADYLILVQKASGASTFTLSWDQSEAALSGTREIRQIDDTFVLDMSTAGTLDLTPTLEAGVKIVLTDVDPSLAVSLNTFSAVPRNERVFLSWTTQTELENMGFEIYRAVDEALDFDLIASFANDVRLLGAGNSNLEQRYEYEDKAVYRGRRYRYRLADVSYSGTRVFHPPISVYLGDGSQMPERFALHQNFPNPFNPGTTLSFDLSEPALVTLEVFNIIGESVGMLTSRPYGAGRHQVYWDAGDLESGVYFYQLRAGEKIDTRRMMLIR